MRIRMQFDKRDKRMRGRKERVDLGYCRRFNQEVHRVLGYRFTNHHTGVVLWGDYWSLESLYEFDY